MEIKKVLAYISILVFNFLSAGDPVSSFTKTEKDIIISSGTGTSVISRTFKLTKTQNVLIVADGSFVPHSNIGKGEIYIKVNNDSSLSNTSIIDWRDKATMSPHAFNCIAAVTLPKGTHTIKLMALVSKDSPAFNFKVGKNAGLSILVDAAKTMVTSVPKTPENVINVTTGRKGGQAPLAMDNMITNDVDAGQNKTNVISLSSGTSRWGGKDGDALWGIFLNDEDCINNGSSQWTVNDLLESTEYEAPMFSHAFHTLSGKNTLKLKAGELSFKDFENVTHYKINKNTRLISLYGMKLAGKAEITNTYCHREEWGFFGSSKKTFQYYWPVGVPKEIIAKEIVIPADHNGIVLFLAKFRLQAGPNGDQGLASLWLNIDGKDVGTISVQGFRPPVSTSSRTISSSYLSSGSSRLSAGKHIVKVYLKSEGTFEGIAHTFDLPLVYFD